MPGECHCAGTISCSGFAGAVIKFNVACDCLRVLIDTVPSWVPEKEQGTQDRRFAKQLTSFERSAKEAIRAIEERGGTAFKVKATEIGRAHV